MNVLSFRPRAGRIEGHAYVDGKLACEATLTCQVVPGSGAAKRKPLSLAEAAPAEAPVETEAAAVTGTE